MEYSPLKLSAMLQSVVNQGQIAQSAKSAQSVLAVDFHSLFACTPMFYGFLVGLARTLGFYEYQVFPHGPLRCFRFLVHFWFEVENLMSYIPIARLKYVVGVIQSPPPHRLHPKTFCANFIFCRIAEFVSAAYSVSNHAQILSLLFPNLFLASSVNSLVYFCFPCWAK